MANIEKLIEKIQLSKSKKEEKERIKLEKEKEKERIKLERKKEKEKLKKEKEALRIKEKEKIKKEKEREKLKKEKSKIREKNKKAKIKADIKLREKLKKEEKIKEEKEERKKNKSYFKIIITSNNKIKETVKSTYFEEDAIKYFNNELDKAIKNVKFPIKYRNTFGKIRDAKDEILLIKKTENEENSSFFKNEYGKYVENVIIDKKNYIIVDKKSFPIEETFFVYGYHPYYDRKNVDFIYNDLILNPSYEYVSVVCFRNKLIIEYCDDMNIVICKNIDDTIRLYNYMKDVCETNNIKKVTFKGQIRYSSYLDKEMRKKIAEKTGWSDTKIRRTSTRP